MQIKRGTSRLVICIPNLGLVIKLPRAKPIVFLRNVISAISLGRRTKDTKKWLKWAMWLGKETDVVGNIRYTLLNGTYQNWQEYCLWRSTCSSFLEPTFFSLLGLINVQKYGDQLMGISAGALWSQLLELSDRAVWSNGHHFANPENFSFRDGTIKMLDYGSRGVEEVVVQYGDVITRHFDPSKKPSWEET